MELGRACHCAYKIRYHMVLCVKYRKWLVRGELASFLLEVLRGIGDRYEFVLDAVGCVAAATCLRQMVITFTSCGCRSEVCAVQGDAGVMSLLRHV